MYLKGVRRKHLVLCYKTNKNQFIAFLGKCEKLTNCKLIMGFMLQNDNLNSRLCKTIKQNKNKKRTQMSPLLLCRIGYSCSGVTVYVPSVQTMV